MTELGTSTIYRRTGGWLLAYVQTLWLGENGVVYSTNAFGLDLQIVTGFKWQS